MLCVKIKWKMFCFFLEMYYYFSFWNKLEQDLMWMATIHTLVGFLKPNMKIFLQNDEILRCVQVES